MCCASLLVSARARCNNLPLTLEGFFFLFLFFLTSSISLKVKSLSRVRLFATLWTVAHHAPLSMGFSRQEYWSGLPFPSPGDLPDPGIKPRSPALQADALTSEPPGKPPGNPPPELPCYSRTFLALHTQCCWLAALPLDLVAGQRP